MRSRVTLLLLLCPLAGCPDESAPDLTPSPVRGVLDTSAPPPLHGGEGEGPVRAGVPAGEGGEVTAPAAGQLSRAETTLAQGRRADAVQALFAAISLADAEPAARAGAVRLLRAQVGLAWHRRSSGELQVLDDTLLLMREGDKLLRLDPASGRVLWRFAPYGYKPRLPALLRNNALVVAVEPLAGVGRGRSARILRLDAATGDARARIDLPAGLAEPELVLGRRGSLCAKVSRPCCGPAGALELADDLAELPEPPDDCDPPEPASAGEAVPRLDLPFECGALAACAGEERAAWLKRLADAEAGVLLSGDIAFAARPEGLYGVDLQTCETLWRLPATPWLRAVVAGRLLFRLGPDLFALNLKAARELGQGKPRWWEPDAGALEVRVGAGRKALLRVGPGREARAAGELGDGGHLLFEETSEQRSLGQPFFRLLRLPLVPGDEPDVRWVWGGDVVPFDAAAEWTPPRCQALSYRVQRTVRDPNLGLLPPVPLRPEPEPGEGGLLIP